MSSNESVSRYLTTSKRKTAHIVWGEAPGKHPTGAVEIFGPKFDGAVGFVFLVPQRGKATTRFCNASSSSEQNTVTRTGRIDGNANLRLESTKTPARRFSIGIETQLSTSGPSRSGGYAINGALVPSDTGAPVNVCGQACDQNPHSTRSYRRSGARGSQRSSHAAFPVSGRSHIPRRGIKDPGRQAELGTDAAEPQPHQPPLAGPPSGSPVDRRGAPVSAPGRLGCGVGLNQAELDNGYCGQNLQVGSDRTASLSATPSFLMAGDGSAALYQISIDGVSIGTFTSDAFGNVCIRTTVPLPDGVHVLTGNELKPNSGNSVSAFNFSVDTTPPPAPSAPTLAFTSDTGVKGATTSPLCTRSPSQARRRPAPGSPP